MTSDNSLNPQPAPVWENSYAIILVFTLNAISAILFMRAVNRPVYDDPYNITDVHAYATRGFSVKTLLAHTNPPGPTSFLWMAQGVHLLKGEELLDARIATLLSWGPAYHRSFAPGTCQRLS